MKWPVWIEHTEDKIASTKSTTRANFSFLLLSCKFLLPTFSVAMKYTELLFYSNLFTFSTWLGKGAFTEPTYLTFVLEYSFWWNRSWVSLLLLFGFFFLYRQEKGLSTWHYRHFKMYERMTLRKRTARTHCYWLLLNHYWSFVLVLRWLIHCKAVK